MPRSDTFCSVLELRSEKIGTELKNFNFSTIALSTYKKKHNKICLYSLKVNNYFNLINKKNDKKKNSDKIYDHSIQNTLFYLCSVSILKSLFLILLES